MPEVVFAGIEAGGTKMDCAVADAAGNILATTRIATRQPDETFADIRRFFDECAARFGPCGAGGIASFGPLDLDRDSPTYGCLLDTPKPGWSSVDVTGRVTEILDAPTSVDTDVNCAAMAEARYGAGQDVDRLCYVTVGTGIGVGLVDRGGSIIPAGHPEAGHMLVPRATGDEDFRGNCPYHGDCLEGLASGSALGARWGVDARTLPPDHVAWRYQAHYIATLCVNLSYTMRPQRIILGGGVMAQPELFSQIRVTFEALLAGYGLDGWNRYADRFIQPAKLVDPSPGLVGAIDLARGLSATEDDL